MIPHCKACARDAIFQAPADLSTLNKKEFLRVWVSVAYLNPGLHTDGHEEWPEYLKQFAVEAIAREERGELSDDELYPADASWAGVVDTMTRPFTAEEQTRRSELEREHEKNAGGYLPHWFD